MKDLFATAAITAMLCVLPGHVTAATPDEDYCQALGLVAMAGAEKGQEIEMIDHHIDTIIDLAGDENEARLFVHVFTQSYAAGVLGIDPVSVGLSEYTDCMSEPV